MCGQMQARLLSGSWSLFALQHPPARAPAQQKRGDGEQEADAEERVLDLFAPLSRDEKRVVWLTAP